MNFEQRELLERARKARRYPGNKEVQDAYQAAFKAAQENPPISDGLRTIRDRAEG